MNKTLMKAAEQLIRHCHDHYNPDGKCKCPFWQRYPYGHRGIRKPISWQIEQKKSTQRGGNRN
ncbi:MAG: hypothetical protein LUE11_06885 [Clostridia bacterium]|nr:hypothetical protein [Clostridia bacterium]